MNHPDALAVAHVRRFYWHELMLWPKDLSSRTVIALSAEDDLVPTTLVQARFLERSCVELCDHSDAGYRQLKEATGVT